MSEQVAGRNGWHWLLSLLAPYECIPRCHDSRHHVNSPSLSRLPPSQQATRRDPGHLLTYYARYHLAPCQRRLPPGSAMPPSHQFNGGRPQQLSVLIRLASQQAPGADPDNLPTVAEFMPTYFGYSYSLRWWCALILAAYILFVRITRYGSSTAVHVCVRRVCSNSMYCALAHACEDRYQSPQTARQHGPGSPRRA